MDSGTLLSTRTPDKGEELHANHPEEPATAPVARSRTRSPRGAPGDRDTHLRHLAVAKIIQIAPTAIGDGDDQKDELWTLCNDGQILHRAHVDGAFTWLTIPTPYVEGAEAAQD